MALPAIAAVAGKALPKIAQGAGKFMKKGGGIPLPEAAEDEEKAKNNIFTPAGVVMLTLGVILDFASIICAVLIIAFGVGAILAKIVYLVGLVITSIWAFARSGDIPIKKGGKRMNPLNHFFKSQWKKLAAKAVPAIGDALPIWTWTIYSYLKA